MSPLPKLPPIDSHTNSINVNNENIKSTICAREVSVSDRANYLIFCSNKLKQIFCGPIYILAAYLCEHISQEGIYICSENIIFLDIQSRIHTSWTSPILPEQSHIDIRVPLVSKHILQRNY